MRGMETAPLPRGSFPTLITPMESDSSIDWRSLDVLLEWQLESGSVGVFSPCQSSEMFNLSQQERVALSKHVKAKVAGRAAHVAVGNFGAIGDIAAQAVSINEIAPHCDVVVLVVGNVAPESASDAEWQSNVEQLLALTPGVRLGLYECPCPYHRLLSPDTLAWCVSTGRFWFHKDTCSHSGQILAKLARVAELRAAEGAKPECEQRAGVLHFRFYNANAATLLMSLEAGGDGFSGISANLYPFLLAYVVRAFFAGGAAGGAVARVQRFLSMVENTVCDRYPTSAKKYLQLGLRDVDVPAWDAVSARDAATFAGAAAAGLAGMAPMQITTRTSAPPATAEPTVPFSDEQTTKLRHLKVEALRVAYAVGISATMPEMTTSTPSPADAPAAPPQRPRRAEAAASEAYATMITSDSFVPGVQALAFSLATAYGRRAASHSAVPPRPLVVLVAATSMSPASIDALRILRGEGDLPIIVKEVNNIPLRRVAESAAGSAAAEDGAHAMGWVETGLTKLHVWNMTEYETVLYIDADAIVIEYTGELFERGDALRRSTASLRAGSAAPASAHAFAAAPDIHPPDRFNAGVMVVCPSAAAFAWLLARARSGQVASYDGGDTGFLNALFPAWFKASAAHRLAFGYNAQRTMYHATFDAAPGYWRAIAPLKIVHFCSWPKPWDSEGARKKGDLELMWWHLFTVSKVPALAAMTDFDAIFAVGGA